MPAKAWMTEPNVGSSTAFPVVIEVGQKKCFASSTTWPGYSRPGKDKTSALQALFIYADRYKKALATRNIPFAPPASLADLSITDELVGSASVDFGVPTFELPSDLLPVGDGEAGQLQDILLACWETLDTVATKAMGKDLAKGPRGGGRDLAKILAHDIEANLAYLAKLGGKMDPDQSIHPEFFKALLRTEMISTFQDAINNRIPAIGPRGGARWTPHFFVRRVAWHTLDHAWEIEDRLL